MGHDGSYMPSFLVDYKAAEESIEYSSELDAKEIILNHYGFVSEADKAAIWDVLMQKLRDSRDVMIDIMNGSRKKRRRFGRWSACSILM